MAAWGYEFYLLVLKVSLTGERSSLVRDTFGTHTHTHILYLISRLDKKAAKGLMWTYYTKK